MSDPWRPAPNTYDAQVVDAVQRRLGEIGPHVAHGLLFEPTDTTAQEDRETAAEKVEALCQEEADRKAFRRLKGIENAERRIREEKNALTFDKLNARSFVLGDFLAVPDEGPKYAIDSLLPTDGNATLVAPKKVGKTTFLGNVLRSFADGEPFLSRLATAPASVALWNYEMSDRQQKTWLRDVGVRNTSSAHVLGLRGIALSLRFEAYEEWAVQWLASRGIQAWIIDPAHRAMTGFVSKTDPNEAVQAFTETLDRIKERSGVRNIVMAVHTGLNGEHARGASRWGDWPDAIWTYAKDEHGVRSLKAEGRDVLVDETPLVYDRETRRLSMPGAGFAQPSAYKVSDTDRLCTWLKSNPGEHPSKRLTAEVLRIRPEAAALAFEVGELDRRLTIRPGARNSHVAWLTEDWQQHEREMEVERERREREAKEGVQEELEASHDDQR
ncbi:AAA family ATPase [Streptomyces sp. NPDC059063]|uniref:AAA family ATPase n=1 Tax=unclassified Streptomyces TaxID=2593676 RepID=UPI0036B784F5